MHDNTLNPYELRIITETRLRELNDTLEQLATEFREFELPESDDRD